MNNFADTLAKAKKKVKKAEYTSDLDSTYTSKSEKLVFVWINTV